MFFLRVMGTRGSCYLTRAACLFSQKMSSCPQLLLGSKNQPESFGKRTDTSVRLHMLSRAKANIDFHSFTTRKSPFFVVNRHVLILVFRWLLESQTPRSPYHRVFPSVVGAFGSSYWPELESSSIWAVAFIILRWNCSGKLNTSCLTNWDEKGLVSKENVVPKSVGKWYITLGLRSFRYK